jgi:hypothetical protein
MGSQIRFAAYVPMDDEHTLHWEIGINLVNPDDLPPEARGSEARGPQPRSADLYKPNTSDWYGRFNMVQSAENDYLIDRQAQRSMQSFTGIPVSASRTWPSPRAWGRSTSAGRSTWARPMR